MGNSWFKFKQFTINQENTAMKVGADSVLLGAWANPENAQSMLDIGTGTGILSLMLAQKSNAQITAIDIDENAYIQACQNVSNSKWKERISVINSSLQDFVNQVNMKFDFIICNPPFFNSSLVPKDTKTAIAKHDVSLSLNELFSGVSQLMESNGRFVLLYQYDRKDEVISIASKHHLFPGKILVIRGNEEKNPNRIIIEFTSKKRPSEYSELAVRVKKTNEYSDEYKALTLEYYIKDFNY